MAMAYQNQTDESYGLQKLAECRTVAVNRQVECCSSSYSVSSDQGILFNSDGSCTDLTLMDGQKRTVMSFKFKEPWFETNFMIVKVVNCQPVTIRSKGGFSNSLLVYDVLEQPKLKIRSPPVFSLSSTYTVLGVDNIEVGHLNKYWGDWDVYFPPDLELRYKAALIAACVYFNIRAQRRSRKY